MAAARRQPKLVRKSATVELEDGAVRLAVVADTHSTPHAKSASLIAAAKPHAILHAGDIGDLEVIAKLETIAPTLAIRGNIDVHAPNLPDELVIDVRDEESTLFKILLTHIAVYGPKLRAEVAQRARADDASMVVCGHSHVPFIGEDKGLTVFNPGSIGPRRFQLPIVFGLLDVSRARVAMQHVSCESGERWLP